MEEEVSLMGPTAATQHDDVAGLERAILAVERRRQLSGPPGPQHRGAPAALPAQVASPARFFLVASVNFAGAILRSRVGFSALTKHPGRARCGVRRRCAARGC
jgi:hypothetical protein